MVTFFQPKLQTKSSNPVKFCLAPRVLENIVELVKRVLALNPEEQKLFRVYGYDKTEYSIHIKKYFDDDQISKAFGGTRVWL